MKQERKAVKIVALEQACLFDDNPEYDSFVAKFEPKKTTDDCYTPPLVYAAIRDWVCDRYDIDPACIVRPFFPGGDFVNYDYPEGCLVLDNPPFSILSEICKFYLAKDIPYFLFAPSLTAFGGRTVATRMNHIICDADITYENGAVVRTAFVTNLDKDIVAETAPDQSRNGKDLAEIRLPDARSHGCYAAKIRALWRSHDRPPERLHSNRRARLTAA